MPEFAEALGIDPLPLEWKFAATGAEQAEQRRFLDTLGGPGDREGTPVVGLFGHTNPWRVGPYRAWEDLRVDACTEPGTPPDPSNTTPKAGRLETIRPEDVIQRVEPALARAGTAHASRTGDTGSAGTVP
jgi:hypothetical protein